MFLVCIHANNNISLLTTLKSPCLALPVNNVIQNKIKLIPGWNSHYSNLLWSWSYMTVIRAFSTQHRKTLFVVHFRVLLLCKSCFNVKSVSRIVVHVLFGDDIKCTFIFWRLLLSVLLGCFHER